LFDAGVFGSAVGLTDNERAGNSAGVVGESDAGTGVYGIGAVGVWGVTDRAPVAPGDTPTGVLGDAGAVGGTGVVGRTLAGIGVHGLTVEHPAGQFVAGVYGESVDPTGQGVGGYSAKGVGVAGWSDQNIGVYGESYSFQADPRHGVPGLAAGYFFGNVIVQDGDLTVVGGAKHAAIHHNDGSHRLLYSIESPESWFEDFGEAKLVKGKADVKLDPDFASTVKVNKYYVFLTPHGDSHGLFVSRRDREGFQVREQGKGSSNISFSYRIVAKRRDIAGTRFAKVKLPRVQPIRPKPSTLLSRRDLPPRLRRRERGVRPAGLESRGPQARRPR